MHLTRVLLFAILAWGLAHAPASAQTEWELIWQDDFSGSDINPDHWEHMIGDGTSYGLPSGWGNNELQYYTDRPENSYVTLGLLHIVARRERYAGFNFTSARLRTRGLQEFQYGRIEARILLPTGKGMWPAFWMLPTDSPYGTWASDGEIDVVETVNVPLEAHGTIHFGGAWPRNTRDGGTVSIGEDLSANFHNYAVEWEPDRFTWFIDDVPYHTVTSDEWWSENSGGNARAPFDHPFHMLLNIAVGGNWPGPPDDTTPFPQMMVVDWVRVSMPRQTPFGGEPHAIPGRVEAEDYDEGWSEQAYSDSDPGNNGNAYRPECDVDLEQCSEGGFNIGWIRPGEWTEYTIDARQGGVYRLRARVASQTAGRFRIEIDGVDRTGPVFVPPTGGWQNWANATAEGIVLTKGEHVVRFVNLGDEGEAFNLNWFELRTMRPSLNQTLPR